MARFRGDGWIKVGGRGVGCLASLPVLGSLVRKSNVRPKGRDTISNPVFRTILLSRPSIVPMVPWLSATSTYCEKARRPRRVVPVIEKAWMADMRPDGVKSGSPVFRLLPPICIKHWRNAILSIRHGRACFGHFRTDGRSVDGRNKPDYYDERESPIPTRVLSNVSADISVTEDSKSRTIAALF